MAKVIMTAVLSTAAIATPALMGAEAAAPIQVAPTHGHIGTGERPLREATLLRALPIRSMLRTEVREIARRIRERKERQRELREQRAAEAAAAAAPAPTYSAPTYSSDGWADELLAVGFPESAIPTMLYIIDRESGGDPSAINSSSGACGLTQIYPYVSGCLNPITNLRLALQKYRHQAADIAIHQRLHEGVGAGRGESLVFADFRRHLRRQADRDVGKRLRAGCVRPPAHEPGWRSCAESTPRWPSSHRRPAWCLRPERPLHPADLARGRHRRGVRLISSRRWRGTSGSGKRRNRS